MKKGFIRVKKYLAKAREFQKRFPSYFEPNTAQDATSITKCGKKVINFCTFSYLGLSKDKEILKAVQRGAELWGVGNHGTRHLGGNLQVYTDIEKKLQIITGKDKALLFNSGYLANLATIQSIMKCGGIIYSARKNHASIEDGLRLANARIVYFDHRNLEELDKKIANETNAGVILIIVDSVFSMDGDIIDLPRLLAIRNRYKNIIVMLDEAHSIGVLGNRGRGIEEHFNISPEKGADILMGSLSKAIPGNGGYIAGEGELVSYLSLAIRPIIFSAGLTGPSAEATYRALSIFERQGEVLCANLRKNIEFLRHELIKNQLPFTGTVSPITTILVGSLDGVFDISERAFREGVQVLPVFFPAVSRNTEKLRLTISASHTFSEIEYGVKALRKAISKSKYKLPERDL